MTVDFNARHLLIEAKYIQAERKLVPGHVDFKERIESQPSDNYTPPVFLRKTATPDQYAEFGLILDELRALNEEHVGKRTREVEAYLHWIGWIQLLQDRLMAWLGSYLASRLERYDPRDNGNKFLQFVRLGEECDQLFQKMDGGHRTDYLILDGCKTYGTWLLYEGTFKSSLTQTDGEVLFNPTNCDPSTLHIACACIRMVLELGFCGDWLDRLLERVRTALKPGELEAFEGRPSGELLQELTLYASSIQEMRPFLVRNFNSAKSSVELSDGFTLAWVWVTRFGIANIAGGDHRMALHRQLVAKKHPYLVGVNQEGLLFNHEQPWLSTRGPAYDRYLPINLYIVSWFHDKLYSYYERIDKDRIRHRALGQRPGQAVPPAIDHAAAQSMPGAIDSQPATEAALALACQHLAEQMGGASTRAGRRVCGLRHEYLEKMLVQSFDCQIRQGKGSEIYISRPNGGRATIGKHGKNPECSSGKVRMLLKRLGIPEQSWIRRIYGYTTPGSAPG
jgi:hypothetical protein